jgi:pimeloyl-ACP methyl ester carboxylesterase
MMGKCQVRDIDLNVVEAGAGPPLLLVHGFPLDHTMWQAQIDELSRDARVMAPDLRGFGESDGGGEVVLMEDFADDLAALLDRLGVAEPVVFCGLSMGGYIAWQFFLRHRARLRALILCDTRAAADAPAAAEARLTNARRVLEDGVGFLAQGMLDKLFAAETRQQRPELVAAVRRVMLAASPQGVAAALRGMAARQDASDLLPQIDVPALVVCGREDAISTVEEMRGIAQRLPQARFVEIAAAGHMSPLEQPQAVNAAVRDFLARLGP